MGLGFGVRVLIHLARVRQVRVFHICNVAASHVLIEHDFVSLMFVGIGGISEACASCHPLLHDNIEKPKFRSARAHN